MPKAHEVFAETQFPASVSVSELMQAGKLVRPKAKQKATLLLEKFDVKTGEWNTETTLQMLIDAEKFSSGGFRDAYEGRSLSPNDNQKWVIKKYNTKAKDTIVTTMKTTAEDHTRKQVQMHSVARQLTKQFSSKVPTQFGQSFHYNRVFYTQFEDEPVTIEEFVPGTFIKYINNNGELCSLPEQCTAEFQELCLKAHCLVHSTYESTNHKLMLLDIQGSGYQLYDPEIATTELFCENKSEIYFCCGNLSTIAIGEFSKKHKCNMYCEMLELPEMPQSQFT
ncbi:hypothetical protein OS493_005647 [Desmophyllum pertusum]|uniref:Alpha-type protein kinase domain-containing protein n=1 Tax=Desmophyllum pertusum TaxID=174260 RepID=A0A9X0CMF8_9CNID|nr:hypothetical protein OS493_005647 [Desmophyllum pertusum]